MPVYAVTKSEKRIKKTLEKYPVKDTYHLDVLTASVFRLDFRKSSPTGKDGDRRARLKIVQQFRDRGFDLTSEACGSPFIGKISYFWHLMRVPRNIYQGDHRIPLTPFIAHGRADYSGSSLQGNGVLDGLLYGSTISDDIKADTPIEDILDAYFLLHIPLDMLRDREMMDYYENGTMKRISYGDDTCAEVDFESGEHKVTVDGELVMKNGLVFFRGKDGTYIFYKSRLCSFFDASWKLPDELLAHKKIAAVPFTDDGDGEPLELDVVDGCIRLFVPESTAYRITVS